MLLADGVSELCNPFDRYLNERTLGVMPMTLIDAWHALESVSAAWPRIEKQRMDSSEPTRTLGSSRRALRARRLVVYATRTDDLRRPNPGGRATGLSKGAELPRK